MTGPQPWPLRPAVPRADLGRLGPPISEKTGESLSIQPLLDRPGWLAKLYRQPRPAQDADRLDALVSAPGTLSEADRRTLLGASSWPVARIFGPGDPTVGCVIPAAPERFKASFAVGQDRELRYVDVDWLAKPDQSIRGMGLTPPGDAGRLSACANLVALAVVLERLGLVYSDWSYSNAFWCPADRSVFVIDIDGCQPGKMPNIRQPSWSDPLTPEGGDADRYTDRFRVALLVARCLTGLRDTRAVGALSGSGPGALRPALPDVLLDMILATDRERRPSVAQLHTALMNGPYLRPQPVPTRMPLPAPPITPITSASTSSTFGVGTAPRLVVIPPRPTTGDQRSRTVSPRAAAATLLAVALLVLVIIITAH